MRICDLTNLYIDGGEGGVNTYLYEKARHLAESPREHEHLVIVPGRENAERDLHGSRLVTVRSPRYFRNPQHRILFNRRAIADLLRNYRPDVVEVDSASRLAHIAHDALAPGGPPIVGFYHVHLPTFFAREMGKTLGAWAGRAVERLAWGMVEKWARPCRRLVVTSRDIHDRLLEHDFPPLAHIPLGVNTRLFHPASTNGSSPPGDADPTILYVGRLSKEKHLSVLFEAFERLEISGNPRLQIVGDGPLRSLVEERASRSERIEYLGLYPYGPDLARRYREASLVALPSPSETFGLSLLEALASGVPVVAVRRGGPSGLIRSDLGALASPDDPADFARQMEKVLRAAPAPEKRRRYIEEEFSWRQTFERLLVLYEEAIREVKESGIV